MALAPFFDRIYGALGGHLSISRESLTEVLQNVAVGICIGPNSTQNDRWSAELATNILARLYPQLVIQGPSELVDELQGLARRINPNIEFGNNAPGETTICVGSAHLERAIHLGATGWVAHVASSPISRSDPPNPYSSGAAAAIGCAELFRRVFLRHVSNEDLSVSLLNFDSSSGARQALSAADIGDVLYVGAGAVGSAGLWALSRDASITGRLTIIDPEDLETSNLQRYVLATYGDIGRAKVQIAKASFASKGLKIRTNRLSLENYANEHAPIESPVIAVSVDNVDGRRATQALLPKYAINGWTSDQALGASWHVFSRDAACLACLYHPHGQGLSAIEQAARALGIAHDRVAILWVTRQTLSEDDIHKAAASLGVSDSTLSPWLGKYIGDLYTDVVCGAVPLDVKGVGKLEVVPLAHQSVLAGIFMAAELVKRTQTSLFKQAQSETLVSWDNVLQAPPKYWLKPRARELGCICGDEDFQNIYAERWPIRKRRRNG